MTTFVRKKKVKSRFRSIDKVASSQLILDKTCLDDFGFSPEICSDLQHHNANNTVVQVWMDPPMDQSKSLRRTKLHNLGSTRALWITSFPSSALSSSGRGATPLVANGSSTSTSSSGGTSWIYPLWQAHYLLEYHSRTPCLQNGGRKCYADQRPFHVLAKGFTS